MVNRERPIDMAQDLHPGLDVMAAVLIFRNLQQQPLKTDTLYVSPGTWGPLMRLGSLNEITCIDLKPAPRL